MPKIAASSHISDVKTVHFDRYSDERGSFMETFRKEWFPERSWDIIQSNRSQSAPGVLRGLHYHHYQVDYWQLLGGAIRVALADVRPASPTFRAVEIIDLDATSPLGVFIPVGVAHGFYAESEATLLYLVDNYYSGSDELGVAWNDPTLAIPWGIDNPILSDRDRNNPLLADIAAQKLPV